MQNILITGANGKIATAIISKYYENNKLFLFSRDKEFLLQKYVKYPNINCYSYEEMDKLNENLDFVLHCAFNRSSNENLLKASVELSTDIFKMAKIHNCKRFINISSQAVYDMVNSKFWTEEDEPKPTDLYGEAKLLCEQLLAQTLREDQYINIRLASLTGVHYQQHVLSKLIINALHNRQIKIVGGKQNFSFMNFYDAINAINLLFNLNLRPEYNIYNIGNGKQYNICDIANVIKNILSGYGKEVEILLEENDINLNTQMSPVRFIKEFNWKPFFSLEDTIKQIIEQNNF